MRIEIVEEGEGQAPGSMFPPEHNYSDLRANPQAIEGIAVARQYLPLHNFLSSINSAESVFTTTSATAKSDLPAAVSAGPAYEFASQTQIVFSDASLNWERNQYISLCAELKELLERDTPEETRLVLRISSCLFTAQKRPGFSLGIRLVAEGSSAQQAELRWGFGLARVQQALLLRSRSLKHRVAG